MVGIFLACVYASILCLKGGVEGPRIFQRAANFLFRWNIVVAVLIAGISVFLFFIFPLAGLFWGDEFFGILFGTVISGILGIFIFTIIIFLMLFELIGAHLLRTSVEKKENVWVWHNGRLIAGFLLIIMSFIVMLGAH